MSEVPDNLKPHVFTSENQPANRGRKPSIFKRLPELMGAEWQVHLTKEDKHRIFEALIEKTPEELKKISEAEEQPVLIKIVAEAILKNELKNLNLDILTIILDRVHGKPKQVTEAKIVSTGQTRVDTSRMTPMERINYYNDLLKTT